MKIPQKPPQLPDLLAEVSKSARANHVLVSGSSVADGDEYLHWDKLRYKNPPNDLSHREWWLLLKLSREAALKPLDLKDRKKNPQQFRFAVPEFVQEQLHQIDLGSAGVVGIPDQILNKHTRSRYLISSLMHEAITSSQLEGALTTREVAKELIRTGRPPRDDSEQMIINNYQTMQELRELKSSALTPELVFHIHRMVTIKTLMDPSAAGRFRSQNEEVIVGDDYGEVFHDPPPSDQLPARLEAMCKFANKETPDFFIHPVVRAIILHFWLAYDHPFVDGNGRTARALFYWAMLNSGYWLFEYISISGILKKSRSKYGMSFLYTETDSNDLTYFIVSQSKVIRKAIVELHEYIARKSSELQETEVHLKALSSFNHRQSALLTHALKNSGQKYTFESHRTCHNISRQTSCTDIYDLKHKNLLIQLPKRGRYLEFKAPSDLSSKLMKLANNDSPVT